MFKGISNSVKKIFGSKYERDVKNYMPIVDEINEIYDTLSGLSHDELRNKTLRFSPYELPNIWPASTRIFKPSKNSRNQKKIFSKKRAFFRISMS